MSSSVVTLTMPAKTEYLILARLALVGIAREVPMADSVLADLKLAVTEACGNAARHAYASDPGLVRVRFTVQDGSIEIEVEDDGSGPGASPWAGGRTDGVVPVEDGMGLALIRAVVDEVEISQRDGAGGTVVRMRKSLLPG
jgi:serine/threonine-protein kinase RsbW